MVHFLNNTFNCIGVRSVSRSLIREKLNFSLFAITEEILGRIRHPLEEAYPVAVPDKQHKPWVNLELTELYPSQSNKSGAELQEIRWSIRGNQSQLLNYDEKSQSINHSAEASMVARKFNEIKKYDKLHGGRGKLVISADK